MRLGDLHRAAERELQDVLNSYPTIRQYAAAGGSLATLATRIKSLVQRRAQIRLVALSENLITPTVVFGTRCVCDDSDENPYTEISRSQNHDAEHIIAIDALLELAQQGEERVAARCTKPPPPAKFFTGLARLKGALLHEQKELLRTGSRLQLINVRIDESETCQKCGKPFNESFDEQIDTQSPGETP
ncbi:MAG: hypothetical protein DMG89_26460 [Acidobacteria bacterium]|nr:MAG: hypothetical protein DMG89_26460 [Acidobacteriota bacterium]